MATDFNADSTLDFVHFASSGANSVVGQVRFSDLLMRAWNGRGGITTYSYESAAKQHDYFLAAFADLVIDDANGLLSWSTRAVLSSQTLSGNEVVPTTRTFRYAQPRFEPAQRVPLGFSLVTSALSAARSQTQYFSQTLGTAGKLRQVDIVDSATQQLRRQTIFDYEVLPGNSPAVGEGSTAGVLVGRIVSQADARFYGTFPNLAAGALLSRTFEYDPKNGDPYSGYGFLTRTTTNRPTGTLVATRRMATPDTTRWIVGLAEDVLITSGGQELARTAFTFSPEGRPTQITRYDGPRGNLETAMPRVTTRTYDVYGNLRSETDGAGQLTEFCFDGDTTFPSGTSCSSPTIEATHSIPVAVRDPLGQVTTYKPHATTGLITEVLHVYSGERDKLEYDGFGRPTRSLFTPSGGSDTVLSETTYVASGSGGVSLEYEVYLDRVQTGGTAALRTAVYRDGFGREVRRVGDAPLVGGQNRYFGTLVGDDLDGLERTTWFPATCGTDAHCTSLSVLGGGPAVPANVAVRDVLGRSLEFDSPDGVSKTDYRSVTRTHPDSGSQTFDAALEMDPRGYLTQHIFDGDRVVWVEECTNAPIATPETADLSSATCQSPTVTFYRYEPGGRVAEIYDAVTPSYTNPANATLRYVYDSLGRVVQNYDIDKTAVQTTAYDAAGRIQTAINARGHMAVFAYDLLGRPSTVTYPLPGAALQYLLTYDNRTREVSQIQHKNGATTVFTQNFFYDTFGRRSREILAYGSNSALVSEFDRDLLNRLLRIRYPDVNTEIAYEYEGVYLKRVCELAGAASCTQTGAIPYLSNVSYDDLGRETVLAGNVSTANPTAPTMSLTYRPDTYRLQRMQVSNPPEGSAGESLDLSYGYDAAGNILDVTDGSVVFGGALDVSFATSYSYDARNRIASRTRGSEAKYFTYDAVGNLTGKQVNSPGSTNQAYDPARRHRVTSAAGSAYGYDADGNVTGRGTQVMTYDGLNRMTCLGTSAVPCANTFTYGPDSVRVAAGGTVGPLRLFVDELFEWEPSTGRSTARIYALGRQIAYKRIGSTSLRSGLELQGIPIELFTPPIFVALAVGALGVFAWLALRGGLARGFGRQPAYGGVALGMAILTALPPSAWASFNTPPGTGTYRRWVWTDMLGSSVHITDGAGSPVHQRAFEPFGGIAKERSSESTDRAFATHEFESALGLYYMEARWYDAVAGRFLSTDPVILDLRNPQLLNTYSYVQNNPLNRVDPTGMFPPYCDGGSRDDYECPSAGTTVAPIYEFPRDLNSNDFSPETTEPDLSRRNFTDDPKERERLVELGKQLVAPITGDYLFDYKKVYVKTKPDPVTGVAVDKTYATAEELLAETDELIGGLTKTGNGKSSDIYAAATAFGTLSLDMSRIKGTEYFKNFVFANALRFVVHVLLHEYAHGRLNISLEGKANEYAFESAARVKFPPGY